MAINNMLITRVGTTTAAGTDDQIDSSSVDMANYDSVLFVAGFGALTANAVTSMHLAGSNDDSTFVDLVGTSGSIADDEDDKVVACLIKGATKYRYIRAEIVRATANAVIEGVTAIQFDPSVAPVTQGATVASAETHADPATGTA